MSARELRTFFAAQRNSGTGLVLASVYETIGATYSKTGARMLITGDGKFQGMLSGGCLEGDLAERAQQVVASGTAQRITYDLRVDDEELWGLGVGCEGLMRILLQPLSADNGFQPFVAMLDVLAGNQPGIAVTVIESDDAATPPGLTLTGITPPFDCAGVSTAVADAMTYLAANGLSQGRSFTEKINVGDHALRVLVDVLKPPPNILILGAGLDAQPVVRLCVELGWRVTVQDHRPAYIEKGEFAGATKVQCVPADSLATSLALEQFDATIVMSHHLLTDLSYLQQLAETTVPYIGLLGPHNRRRRLLTDLGEAGKRLTGRLHGPAGLDIGGRGPASIALSIVAQMHEVLMTLRGDE
jgi:xanthine/CO dehydrogenase XdhC/CoxF family maturation factor